MVKKRRGQSAAFMRSINPNLKRRSKNVVRRSRSRSRRRTFAGRRRGSSGSSKMSFLAAALYGAARSPLANWITPFVARFGIVPANLADEVGMGAASWAAQKYGSGMIRDAGKAGLTIETARLAESLVSGSMTSSTSATSSGMLW